MTIWYRAHQAKNPSEVFSGAGGLYVGGRWNYAGNKVIYCSESIALCTLEWLANHGLSVSGFSYYRYSIDVPDNLIFKPSLAQLPKDWDAVPATDLTRDFSDKYLFSSARYLALASPSVVVPEEYNLVINPLHSAFVTIAKNIRSIGKYVIPVR
jgi:RES domain-containing protein